MKGLGIEVAKNVVLGGVKSLTIHDPHDVEIADLSAQFFLRAEDVGRNRAEVSASRLAELNPYVPIDVLSGELTGDKVKSAGFRVVVLTNSLLAEQLAINDYTHSANVCFISAAAPGLFGHVFCDFGVDFSVTDTNGENPVSAMVGLVTSAADGVVTTLDEARHGLEDGDYVTFSEIVGMEELNGCEPRKVKVIGPYSFSIGDTSLAGTYVRGGAVQQVKQPKLVAFKSLRESLKEPEMLIADWAKMERPALMHLGFQAVDAFTVAAGHLPRPANAADAAEVFRLAKSIDAAAPSPIGDIDADLLATFASHATGELMPMCSFIGGTAAQEVMKACSGKYSPIKQHLYFDSLESLPEDSSSVPEMMQPTGSRHDAQIAVFGSEFQKKLGAANYLLVGSGAIGCELLKNFAMIGLCSGPNGMLTVTDMDTIENSNLNRQFLFRKTHIGKAKSHTAAAAATDMNPGLNVTAHENKMGPETESVYNDKFMRGLDGVANALDNVEARQYMDRRCVYYNKPLLESGTLGSKGNTQVVLPHLTESYSSTRDPPEATIPICTLKSFPNKIEHTLQVCHNPVLAMPCRPGWCVNILFDFAPSFVSLSVD